MDMNRIPSIKDIANIIHSGTEESREFRASQDAFQAAIIAGRLSGDQQADNYAGDYMYMGERGGKSQFKNINTRKYLD